MPAGKSAFFLICLCAFVLVPTSLLDSGHSICLFRNLFGVECPGCGMIRAISSVFHGNFAQAFQYNKLVVIVLPLLCYTGLKTIARDWVRIKEPDIRG